MDTNKNTTINDHIEMIAIHEDLLADPELDTDLEASVKHAIVMHRIAIRYLLGGSPLAQTASDLAWEATCDTDPDAGN